MENKEYEALISKFYDLDVEKKKKEIFDELERTESLLDMVLQFKTSPVSNGLVKYDENAVDSESDNLVKIYNNILVIQESLIAYLKDKGY